jgi:hypothetical protein
MVFGICGYPRRIVSDNESMLKSKEFKEWLIVKGIEKTFTAVYNPRANGIDERFNQTLLNMINSASLGRDWDVDIWDLFYFYNLATQTTTEISPFYLQYVRKGNLPVDLTYGTNETEDVYTIKDLTSLANIKIAKATERTLKVVEKKHGKLDKRRRMTKFRPFKVGDQVIVKEPNLETKAKSKPIGTGPWTIHRVVGRNTYKIRDKEGKKLKYLVNGRRMALITPRRKTAKQDDGLDYFEMWYEDSSGLPVREARNNKAQQEDIPLELPGSNPNRGPSKPLRGLAREAAEAQEAATKAKQRAARRGEPERKKIVRKGSGK